MAVGKSKKPVKGKKGVKRRVIDPYSRKEWYDIKAPGSLFSNRDAGKTLVTRTTGTKIASEQLKGRIVECNLADLNKDEDQAFRKMYLRIEDVQGRNVLTNFYAMSFTTDKLRSLVRKWQRLIEASVDVNTTDGYRLRLFCIAFTKRQMNQVKKTAYATSAQVRAIRKKMTAIMEREASNCDLKDLVKKFIPESIGREIEKSCYSIYPLQNVYIRKVKMLRSPKFDITKLMELHTDDSGSKVNRAAEKQQ
eukprot:Rmarinus@m.25984